MALPFLDYDQQRRDLLHKYGIDLDDGAGIREGVKHKRLDRKEVDKLMGGQNGEGVFTWRERNRKKVGMCQTLHCIVLIYFSRRSWLTLCKIFSLITTRYSTQELTPPRLIPAVAPIRTVCPLIPADRHGY